VALVTGVGLGFLVAAEVGPIWLLCLRTSARHGFRPGAAVGAHPGPGSSRRRPAGACRRERCGRSTSSPVSDRPDLPARSASARSAA